jgi:hypothetical protein
MRLRTAVLTLLCLTACSNRPLPLEDGGGSQEGGDTGVSATRGEGPGSSPTTGVSTTPSGTGDTGGTDGTGGPDSTDEGQVFVEEFDIPTPPLQCNLEAQDCGRGFKCVPVSVNSTWDGTACVPVVEDPQGIGDPCQLDDPVTGVDDCGGSQFCWEVDKTGAGECIGLCIVEDRQMPFEYSCEDPAAKPTTCQTCFCICIAQCDPLLQDCPEGQGCYGVNDGWQCAPDASDGAGQDAPCEFINGCAPGHVCLAPESVPTCEGGVAGCCTAICDTSTPDPCPGQELGMACTSWYEKGQAPPGYETVGVCVAPP